MDNFFMQVARQLMERRHGPFGFRLILQPLMAVILALRDGRRDAKRHERPYFWAIFTSRGRMRELLHNGWKSVAKLFILATILDLSYQVIEFSNIRLVEALMIAVFLAIVPYLLLRGPINRLYQLLARRPRKNARAD